MIVKHLCFFPITSQKHNKSILAVAKSNYRMTVSYLMIELTNIQRDEHKNVLLALRDYAPVLGIRFNDIPGQPNLINSLNRLNSSLTQLLESALYGSKEALVAKAALKYREDTNHMHSLEVSKMNADLQLANQALKKALRDLYDKIISNLVK